MVAEQHNHRYLHVYYATDVGVDQRQDLGAYDGMIIQRVTEVDDQIWLMLLCRTFNPRKKLLTLGEMGMTDMWVAYEHNLRHGTSPCALPNVSVLDLVALAEQSILI